MNHKYAKFYLKGRGTNMDILITYKPIKPGYKKSIIIEGTNVIKRND